MIKRVLDRLEPYVVLCREDGVFTALKIDQAPTEFTADHTGINDEVWPAQTTVKYVFPDLALSEAFARANYLTKYLLEGMAVARFAGDEPVPEKMLLGWLKRELKRSFQDVLNSVKRPVEK